jgi:hypothetical protein
MGNGGFNGVRLRSDHKRKTVASFLCRDLMVDWRFGTFHLRSCHSTTMSPGITRCLGPVNAICIAHVLILFGTEVVCIGIRPAANVWFSANRVGSAARIRVLKQVAGTLKGGVGAVPLSGGSRSIRFRAGCVSAVPALRDGILKERRADTSQSTS